jgi:hypothetical protein
MIKIPYGQSHFESVITGNYFYQDRSMFIGLLENWNSKYPIFLRPRRFGKSLFVSMLHYYYDLTHKSKFQELFGHLQIGQQTTPLANSFMVLRLDFSAINTATHETTFNGFLDNVRFGINGLLGNYKNYFGEKHYEKIQRPICQ